MRRSQPPNRLILLFCALGFLIPILLYALVSFVDRNPRAHTQLGHFLWVIAIPYLWPSAAALLPARTGIGEALVFWMMCLALNVAIYAAVGFVISRLSRLASKYQQNQS
jgi:hypothetical protein